MEPTPSLAGWLRLARAPGIGPGLGRTLLDRFGNPEAVFSASRREIASIPGMGGGRLDALFDSELPDLVRREADRAAAIGVRFVCLDDECYPPALRGLAAPPLVLSVRGALLPADRVALAVVGPRIPSEYARRMTRRLVPPLSSRGVTVVSGMAQGIDAEAHAAALRSTGRTLAVLGQGLDTPLYPASNRDLADRIVEENLGAIISAFPLGTRPHASLYPQRNELLAALGLGLLVVEAGDRSGALITARHALDFGRTVMACPGDADRATARGSNRLLAEGAALVQASDDVLEALQAEIRRELVALGHDADSAERPEGIPDESCLGASAPRHGSTPGPPLGERRPHGSPGRAAPDPPGDSLTRTIHALVWDEHRPLDFILHGCAEAGFSHGAVIQRLLEMELNGGLRQLPGRLYARPE